MRCCLALFITLSSLVGNLVQAGDDCSAPDLAKKSIRVYDLPAKDKPSHIPGWGEVYFQKFGECNDECRKIKSDKGSSEGLFCKKGNKAYCSCYILPYADPNAPQIEPTVHHSAVF